MFAAPATRSADAVLCFADSPSIRGTPGIDRLIGTPDRDVVHGLGGPIDGRGGDAALCGGDGNDGRDRVDGGTGRDRCRGAEVTRRCP